MTHAADHARSRTPYAEGGQVVILTGPPGAGKSAVARLLADAYESSVHLHADDFWHYIKRGALPPYLPEAHRQNQVVIRVIAEAAFGYARGGYRVVVDGIVGPWFLDAFRETAAATDVPMHYVVLRPDQATTVHRATSRGPGALTAPEPVRSLHRQFSGLEELEAHVADSTDWTPEETADRVRAALDAGAYVLT
ncbi:AAA family ATPase [Yinghuangia soli]|uniref:AAA family ATPase n=1 Tax=Yinghuangia soli TaxID=2908204 RepID=A0AA41Q487_9ACTN|nr:AAA family ATPase [Yinghuangia soli]MCF2530917.1 AAA family ATPase [Yinghuangia soli]